jgi:thiol-disulfide isomerase/thioredoxin
LQQQKRGLNFGELFLRRADAEKSKLTRRDAHVVHIRTGDVIACRVESIDQRGVHLSTVDSEDGFVPRAKVKAIELVTNAPPPDLAAAKRDRLLTLPRLQKSSPPTHLLCSQNGDYLRCRLLAMDEDNVYVEVQLEEIQIPRNRITQIIWFHDDELPKQDKESGKAADPPSADESESPFLGLAQVLRRDGKRLTFDPIEVTEKTIAGTSEVLGKCRFDLMEVDQLIFGARIGEEVADFAYNQWKLHPATEPLVAQDSPDGPVMGSDSPLIGADAPEVRLELLDGSDFQLSKCKGQIVVLDFWATWCAPCMQTMPLIEEAMAEFDPEKVRLVSVNLEEPADHVRGVLDRHGLNLTVALDIDGVAAQRYQANAIPQLVIVGPDGKVERLYVGGGSRVVEQMKAAIAELLESSSL